MRSLKRCLALVLLSFLFAQTGHAVEPGLISEIPVEGKTVSGNILDGNLILSVPDKMKVLTPDGKEFYQANLKPNQGLVISEDGEFFGIITFSKTASPDFLTAENFDLHYANGNKLMTIEKPGVSDFYISSQANLVVGVSGNEGSQKTLLMFYRPANLFKNREVAVLKSVSFSLNGKNIFINSGKDGLLVFDDSLNLIVNFGLCEKFASSSDGEFVATIHADTLRFYHQGKPGGDPLGVNPFIREMSFSSDNKYLGVVDKKNLFVFEAQTGKIIWKYTIDQPELSFISLNISGNAEKIVAGIDFDKGRKVVPEERHTSGFVYLFDKDGRITWKKELSYKLWGAVFPQVRFSSDETRFSVITREKIYVFKL